MEGNNGRLRIKVNKKDKSPEREIFLREYMSISLELKRDFFIPEVSSVSDVRMFLDQARGLGSTIHPQLLDRFREPNHKVLDFLEAEYRLKQPPIEQGKIAVVIPAHRESGIGGILSDVIFQSAVEFEEGNISSTDIIVVVNGEDERGETNLALKAFFEKRKLPVGVSLSVLGSHQGKLVAYDNALDFLEGEETFPETVYFFDADARVEYGCLSSMMAILRSDVSAAGAMTKFDAPKNLLDAIHQLHLKDHGGGEVNKDWLHGGAFALNADLIPLFHAYAHAFPGTVMNDTNFTQVLVHRGINYKLTDMESLKLEPPETFSGLIRQQDRWLTGFQQSIAFNKNPHGIVPTSRELVLRRLREYERDFEKIWNQYLKRGEALVPPFYLLMHILENNLEKPIVYKNGGNQITMGGLPTNIYLQRYWTPPRKYL